jgi:hypothetical protein
VDSGCDGIVSAMGCQHVLGLLGEGHGDVPGLGLVDSRGLLRSVGEGLGLAWDGVVEDYGLCAVLG